MSSDQPPFTRIAIVGLGLIGGSIALAVRERWSSVLITAVDRAPVLAHASSSGAIDRAANTVADIGPVDLIILAAPVRQNVQLLAQVMPRLSGGAIVTDVGGTKRDIVSAAAGLPSGTTSFVGGHPIGGPSAAGSALPGPICFAASPGSLRPLRGIGEQGSGIPKLLMIPNPRSPIPYPGSSNSSAVWVPGR